MRWCTGTTRSPRRSRFEYTMTASASTIRALYLRVGRSRSCWARTRPGPTTRTSRTPSSGPAKSSRGDAGSTAFFVLAEGPGHRNRRSTWSLEAFGSSLGFRMTTWRASAWRESAARVRTRPPRDQAETRSAPSRHQVGTKWRFYGSRCRRGPSRNSWRWWGERTAPSSGTRFSDR